MVSTNKFPQKKRIFEIIVVYINTQREPKYLDNSASKLLNYNKKYSQYCEYYAILV